MTWAHAFQLHPGEMIMWVSIAITVAAGFLGSLVAAVFTVVRGHDRRRHPRYRYYYPRWGERRRIRLPHAGDVYRFHRGGPGIAA